MRDFLEDGLLTSVGVLLISISSVTGLDLSTQENTIAVKCCDEIESNCNGSSMESDYMHKFSYNSGTYQVRLTIIGKVLIACPTERWTQFEVDELDGFTDDSSVFYSNHIYKDSSYCVEVDRTKLVIWLCLKPEVPVVVQTSKVIPIYLPLLVLSTLCYFLSAFVYTFILKVKEVHRKCFIGYSFSMGMTFLFLILLQTSNGRESCNIIGSLFFFFIMESFVWLACLCIDLAIIVRNFKADCEKNRFCWYMSFALGIPSTILGADSIYSSVPDVPASFMKPNGQEAMCSFEGSNLFFFITVGTLMLLIVGILIYIICLICRYNKLYRCHVKWLETKDQFKYKTQSCSLIWLTSAIWIIDVALTNNTPKYVNTQVLDVIEALQGVIAVAIFVSNRYTRREFREKFCTRPEENDNRPRQWTTFRKVFNLKSQSPNENTNDIPKCA